MKIYAVTLQTGKRKTETKSYFTTEEVANHFASTLSGYTDDEGTVATGVVVPIEVAEASSVEEYEQSLEVNKQLEEREKWAEFYNSLTEEQQIMMAKHAPSANSNAPDPSQPTVL